MRKLVYSALAFGAALAVTFSAGAVASAEENESPSPSPAAAKSVITADDVDLVGDLLIINASADANVKQVLVGTAKDSKNGLTVSSWDVYEKGDDAVRVDLSKVNKAKDAYIEIKAVFEPDSKALIVKVPASDTIKAKYDKKTGDITITDKNNAPVAKSDVSYRTDSLGGPLEGLDLYTYQMSGGVIYVAKNPSAGEADTKADVVLKKRASKEVKLAIGKFANAPKLKANYVTGQITIPAKAYYRSYTVSDATIPATQAALDKATAFDLSTATSYTDKTFKGTEEFAVDVQTAADPGKKLASKLGHYVFPALTETDPSKVTYKKADGSEDIVIAKDKATLTITNTDADNAYTITWWQAGVTDATKFKTAKLAAGNGKTVKLANIATASGISVQRQGNSKKGSESWAGTKAKLIEGPLNANDSAGGSAATYGITITGAAASHLTASATADIVAGTTVTITSDLNMSTALVITVKNGDENVSYTLAANASEQPNRVMTFDMPAGNVVITVTEA